jgi:hypothetical protein
MPYMATVMTPRRMTGEHQLLSLFLPIHPLFANTRDKATHQDKCHLVYKMVLK